MPQANSGQRSAPALSAEDGQLPSPAPPDEPANRAGTGGPAIDVSHLYKKFGSRTAVEDVSFSVAHGEVFGFLGPNGAGKTTTVRMLSTLIAPTAGSAVVAGISVDSASEAEIRQRIAIMPENPGLYRKLSVSENLEFFARLYEIPNREARIKEALDAVDLGNRAQDATGSLSKGLRQRVALARTLLNNPVVMFLDEPTAGLDPVAAREVGNLIITLRERGVTVFLTTHLLDEAQRLCDRVGILNTRLRTIGTPEELRRRVFTRSLAIKVAAPLGKPGKVFAGQPDVQDWRPDGPSDRRPASYVLTVTDPATAAPAVTRALVGAGADVLSITESQHSLEDVYLQLIEDKES